MNENEYKFTINVVYWKIVNNPETGLTLAPGLLSQEFKTYKEAAEEFQKIKRSKLVKSKTQIGEIAFDVISVELIDNKKYKKYIEETIKLQEETKDKEEELNGNSRGDEIDGTETNREVENADN